ncbi:MAG: LacI family DNA-binding transcriptional regulator [Capsulimonadaceae bacterium]|nr:LacI family DNA-binding transcriptional regulator [Capsulimonadaceae bacterium]
MPVTLRDIARRANVSHATVSVVLNQRTSPIISEKTRQKVLKVADELGYQPNHLARALATGRSYIVALWVVDPYSPYASRSCALLQDLVRAEAYDLMLVEAAPPLERSQSQPPRSHWPVDGIIALDCPWRVASQMTAIHKPKAPIVSIGRVYSTATDFVGIDVAAGISDAIAHLVQLGRTRIAFLSGSDRADEMSPLLDAYTAALGAAGLITNVIEADSLTRSAGYAATAERVAGYLPFDALVTYNDLLGAGALKALRDAGISVPEQVAVVACSSTEELEYQAPPLTVIEHPLREMCSLGWQYLQRRLAAPDLPPQRAVLKPELVIRGSSVMS